MVLVDRLSALLLLALAAVYYHLSGQVEVGFVSDLLGPRAFPRLLALLLALTSVVLFARSFGPSARRTEPYRAEAERLSNLWIALGLTVAYLLLLPAVGFLILTPVLLGAFIRVLGYRRWPPLVGTAAGVTVVLWFLFARLLGVRLPAGLLDD